MLRNSPVVGLSLGLFILIACPLAAQQSYVARFDAYGGYGFLSSSSVNMFENGFAAQAGFRPKTWVSIGVDYTNARGDLTLKPEQLLPETQAKLQAGIAGGVAAGKLPANYPYASLSVPAHS